jgi:hypothetical protein
MAIVDQLRQRAFKKVDERKQWSQKSQDAYKQVRRCCLLSLRSYISTCVLGQTHLCTLAVRENASLVQLNLNASPL